MAELLFNALLLVFFIAMVIVGMDIRIVGDYWGARYYPVVLAGIAVILFAVKVARIWIALPKEKRKFSLEIFHFKESGVKRLLIGFALCAAYVLLLPYGGYLLTTFLFGASLSALLGATKIRQFVLAGLGITVPLYVVFCWGLNVLLPRGAGFLYYISLWIETLV